MVKYQSFFKFNQNILRFNKNNISTHILEILWQKTRNVLCFKLRVQTFFTTNRLIFCFKTYWLNLVLNLI